MPLQQNGMTKFCCNICPPINYSALAGTVYGLWELLGYYTEQESILLKFDFFVFPNFATKLGHFLVNAVFSSVINT
jgi:hypothetical protein